MNIGLTPIGKRTSRYVPSDASIRWYVGGRIYRTLAFTMNNAELTREWMDNVPVFDRNTSKSASTGASKKGRNDIRALIKAMEQIAS